MIHEPFFIVLILFVIVIIATQWSHRFQHSRLMRIFPTPLWCYIPPTVLTTCGILPSESAAYEWMIKIVLPPCLILLLMTTQLKGLRKIGRAALVAMGSGTLTVIIGAVMTFLLFRAKIGPDSWKAVGTLIASWIGGTANMIAVKQAVGLPETIFPPLFISDVTTVYLWMTLLMLLSGYQEKIDGFLHADRKSLEEFLTVDETQENAKEIHDTKRIIFSFVKLFCVGAIAAGLATWLGKQMPEIGIAINRSTWIIILITTFGLMLSFTSYAHRESQKAGKLGYFLLYLMLTASGAKANLIAILKTPLFLAMALVLVLIHGILLLGLGRIFRIPIALLAIASQANVGGVASTPIVASTYNPKLASIALILAVLGNAAANYLAILTAYFLHALGS
jgi:uncharacterized membrane protein